MKKVKDIYEELLGKDFSGTYQGSFNKYDKEWEKIQVDPDDPIMETLDKVKDQVQDKVWKGFTGTEDGPWYTDYCLYVEVVGSPQKERFRISNAKPFPVTEVKKYSWNVGVRMTVKGID